VLRGDLAVLYMPRLAVPSGALTSLTMRPFRVRNFRLNDPSAAEATWLQATLDRESKQLGTRVVSETGNPLSAVW
jgi:poly-gamma-glutamate synthesis protein (capsule biosynthesis protein)